MINLCVALLCLFSGLKPNATEELLERQESPRKTLSSTANMANETLRELKATLREFYSPWNAKVARLLKDDIWLEWNRET